MNNVTTKQKRWKSGTKEILLKEIIRLYKDNAFGLSADHGLIVRKAMEILSPEERRDPEYVSRRSNFCKSYIRSLYTLELQKDNLELVKKNYQSEPMCGIPSHTPTQKIDEIDNDLVLGLLKDGIDSRLNKLFESITPKIESSVDNFITNSLTNFENRLQLILTNVADLSSLVNVSLKPNIIKLSEKPSVINTTTEDDYDNAIEEPSVFVNKIKIGVFGVRKEQHSEIEKRMLIHKHIKILFYNEDIGHKPVAPSAYLRKIFIYLANGNGHNERQTILSNGYTGKDIVLINKGGLCKIIDALEEYAQETYRELQTA